MTTPLIPNTPKFPDVEKGMCTLLDQLLAELTPAGYACVIPPSDFEERIANGEAIVTVQRSGGTKSQQRALLDARVFISVTTAERSASWEVLAWLQEKFEDVHNTITNPDGTHCHIASISDMQGSQREPALSPDMRRVTSGHIVTVRKER